MRTAPSSVEYSVCRCRWTKGSLAAIGFEKVGMAGIPGKD
ncbi:MAG: hypothetical protein ACI9MB_005023 [Verrucomicrobiales bacterium]